MISGGFEIGCQAWSGQVRRGLIRHQADLHRNCFNCSVRSSQAGGLFDLGEALEHLSRSGIRLAVIDTPPAITESIS
jgi:hypothetical protein